MYLISDFNQEQKEKPKRDYSWIVPTALGVGTLAAIGIGLAAGAKGINTKNLAKAEKTIKKTKTRPAKEIVGDMRKSNDEAEQEIERLKDAIKNRKRKSTVEVKPLKSANIPRQKSNAKAVPAGLDPIEKTIEIKKRKLRLKINPETMKEVYQYTKQGGQKRTFLTQIDIDRRRDAINSMITANKGEYSGLYLITDL